MHVAVLTESSLEAAGTSRTQRPRGRWVEAGMLVAAILLAPFALLLGLVIYTVRGPRGR